MKQFLGHYVIYNNIYSGVIKSCEFCRCKIIKANVKCHDQEKYGSVWGRCVRQKWGWWLVTFHRKYFQTLLIEFFRAKQQDD